MLSPAYDLAIYLADNGVGVIAGAETWSVNATREPIDPDDCVTLYDTGGDPPDTDEQDIFRPTFQVRVRSRKRIINNIDAGYELAYTKHEEIRGLLIGGPIQTNDAFYAGIVMTSDILAIGRDDNDRHLLVANYRVIRERS